MKPHLEMYSDSLVTLKNKLEDMWESPRHSFHMFTLHGLLSLALVNDFEYTFEQCISDENTVCVTVDFRDLGKVYFKLDLPTNYVQIEKGKSFNTMKNLKQYFIEKGDN